MYILYSSGTTGVPKCIVHCVGVSGRNVRAYRHGLKIGMLQGLLMNGLKEGALSYDMGQDDCYFQYTTVGPSLFHDVHACSYLSGTSLDG